MPKKSTLVLIFLWMLVCPVQAQEPYKVYLPMILSSLFNSDNNWRIVRPVGSTNYVLNPSAEIAGNFAALAGTTVTRVTTYQKYGLYSYRIESNADNEGISLTLLALSNANHFVTMRVRGTLPAAWDWSLDNSIYTEPRLIEKIDKDWNLYGLQIQAAQANGSTTLYIRQNGAGTGDFYLDGIQVEPLTYWTTYIDGTQDGCGWNGIEHASTSTRSGQSRAGGQPLDFWTEYGFKIVKIVGAGAASHNLGVDSYAILPGGELNSDKVLSREFQIIGKFIAETEADLLENKRALESAFYTVDNQLTRLRFNGGRVQKEIAVRYRSGLEGDLSAFYGNVEIVEDEKLVEHQLYTERAAIQVVAPYPYWQEVGESAALLDTNDSATFRTVAARLKNTGQWDTMGPPDAGGGYGYVAALVEDETYIYAGGSFSNFDNIANADNIVRFHKLNGTWSAMGSGLNGVVNSLALAPNGDLYIGGEFTNAGGIGNADYLTRWDGTNYNAVGTPLSGSASIFAVYALVFDKTGNLFIGGNFSNWANIANADSIVVWNGSSYTALSTGIIGSVLALTVNDTNLLFIGGLFSFAGGIAVSSITSWNGSVFSWQGNGVSAGGVIFALTYQSNKNLLYIGGEFSSINNTPVSNVAVWNGINITNMGSGINDIVRTIAVAQDGTVYIGGQFSSAGNILLNDKITRWNGYSYAHLDLDLSGTVPVYTIIVSKFVDSVTLTGDIFIGFLNTVSSSDFAGKISPTNEGNVQAFPKLIFERIGGTTATIATLKNETTGKELLFNYSLLNGERLTVDLNPTQRSIISSFFGFRPDAILANSDFGLWSLQSGSQDVTSFVATTGSPTITAWMLWREAYSSY